MGQSDYRTSDEIKRDILKSLRRRTPFTKLLRRSHASYTSMCEYLGSLLNANLISVDTTGSRRFYKITDKGKFALKIYDAWRELNDSRTLEEVEEKYFPKKN